MKYMFLTIFCILCGSFPTLSSYNFEITSADQITEEFLTQTGDSTHYTEHVSHLKRVFNKIHVRTFLEFGLGFSTKFFLDHSEHVISVEFITPGTGPEWMKYCIKLYRHYGNWTPLAFFSGKGLDSAWAHYKYMGINSVYLAAAYWPVHRKSYAAIDPSFLADLNNFMNLQVSNHPIDVAFVDCGICLRGDLVQTLFNKVPIIAAHDIARKEVRAIFDGYGYGEIKVPDNYVEIYVPFGMGTAFWVKKEPRYYELIKDLQIYANLPPEKGHHVRKSIEENSEE